MGLTAKTVSNASGNQKLADGQGLYLIVKGNRKAWSFLYQREGRRREMGLGAYPAVTLAGARQKASAARAEVLAGRDPIKTRAASEWTFGAYAERVMNSRELRGDSLNSWKQSLRLANPLDARQLDDITTADILDLVRPIWVKTPELGHMLRMRLEMILDHATAEELREGANPARWKAHMDRLLPKRKRTRAHFKSLAYSEVPAFMASLKERKGLGPIALRIVILTASRTKMVLGARWDEIEGNVWTVPAERMKYRRDFQIPLSTQVVRELGKLPKESEYLFPWKEGTLGRGQLLRLSGDAGVTSHGFRSSFKDWAMDETDHGWEVSEQALAHLVGDEASQAYRRGTAFNKRQALMQDWADYVDQ